MTKRKAIEVLENIAKAAESLEEITAIGLAIDALRFEETMEDDWR